MMTSSDPVTFETRSRVEIVDLTDLTRPKFAGSSIPADGPLHISRGRLFSHSTDSAAVLVYDLSDPIHPQRVAQFNAGWLPTSFSSEDRLYTVDWGHMPNLDVLISVQTSPRNLGHLALALGRHGRELVNVQGRYAYIADSGEGVKVVDLTRPANPQAKLTYGKEFQGGAVAGDIRQHRGSHPAQNGGAWRPVGVEHHLHAHRAGNQFQTAFVLPCR